MVSWLTGVKWKGCGRMLDEANERIDHLLGPMAQGDAFSESGSTGRVDRRHGSEADRWVNSLRDCYFQLTGRPRLPF